MPFPNVEVDLPDCQENWEYLSTHISWGNGSPLNVVKGIKGALYLRLDGGANTTLYVKEADSGATTGWVAK